MLLKKYDYFQSFKIFALYTSNLIRRLIWFGSDAVGIEKMRSIFFQRSECSAVEITKPYGLSKSELE